MYFPRALGDLPMVMNNIYSSRPYTLKRSLFGPKCENASDIMRENRKGSVCYPERKSFKHQFTALSQKQFHLIQLQDFGGMHFVRRPTLRIFPKTCPPQDTSNLVELLTFQYLLMSTWRSSRQSATVTIQQSCMAN